MGKPLSASAASTRSAPRCATPSRTARTSSGRPDPRVKPDQGAAGAEVPHRRAQAQEGRDEPHVAGRLALGRHVGRLGRGSEDAEVVAQPLHARTGRQHDRLDAPGRDPTHPEGDDGKRAVRVPAGVAGGGPVPVHWSSMPPVPKVALASPGRVQPCPTSDAC